MANHEWVPDHVLICGEVCRGARDVDDDQRDDYFADVAVAIRAEQLSSGKTLPPGLIKLVIWVSRRYWPKWREEGQALLESRRLQRQQREGADRPSGAGRKAGPRRHTAPAQQALQ